MQYIKTDNQPCEVTMKLRNSTSDQNVVITYVCLINDVKPTGSRHYVNKSHRIQYGVDEVDIDAEPIQVERSKALHELVESRKHEEVLSKNNEDQPGQLNSSTPAYPTITFSEDSELSDMDDGFSDPKILKLTKMKWLSESQGGTPDSSISLSPAPSTTSSNFSRETEYDDNESDPNLGDKYLSTILRIDKEHNLFFGLSNIAIVGSRQFKKMRKDEDNKPLFPQTTIVQVVYTGCVCQGCCRHKSKSDFPRSLKCGTGCTFCCLTPSRASCLPQRTLFDDSPRSCPAPPCPDLLKDKPSNDVCPTSPCSSPPCPEIIIPPEPKTSCATNCVGVKIKLNRKPVPVVQPIEITPRSRCILTKPLATRTCYHIPPCVPPGPGFPLLLPCFWPVRPNAPCSDPKQCLHNPTCPNSLRPSYLPEITKVEPVRVKFLGESRKSSTGSTTGSATGSTTGSTTASKLIRNTDEASKQRLYSSKHMSS
ncbi:uncharacterized protein LOC113238167 isoform X1 [Hyposmocoma kahamanoa]|uniref:uncharacterized protein LOC113238167 isoform X1 n=1 Tax=Hyposmocoma kahamanoa TaxID=1477025 RepID=UPI000E6D99B6|nr:uncharacterized protein LOC113238167 isoform X1 [Hyposmocoma kahamanoa]XP_026330710.1 uncharacterized protein LOC113238167 isoform X1 [Hyposmocoma kahamanoa]